MLALETLAKLLVAMEILAILDLWVRVVGVSCFS